jgi:hypothetical protein
MLALGLFFNASGTLVNLGVVWPAGSARTVLESAAGRLRVGRAIGALLIAPGPKLTLSRFAASHPSVSGLVRCLCGLLRPRLDVAGLSRAGRARDFAAVHEYRDRRDRADVESLTNIR